MSRIVDLITDLCPDGVEQKPLAQVGEFIRGNGLQKSQLTETGIPAIHYGQIHTVYGVWTEKTKSYVPEALSARLRRARPGDVILATTSEDDEAVGKATAWIGSGEVAVSGDAYIFRHNLDPRYVAYFLNSRSFQEQKHRYITGTKVRRLSGASLAKILIPVPPMEVQREIVRILDTFSALETELEAELEARRVQYAHYREEMISGAAAFPRVRMDECGELFRGKRFVKDDILDAGHPCMHYGEIYTKYGVAASESFSYLDVEQAKRLRKARPGDVVIATAGETIEDIGTAVAWMGKQEVVVHDACYVYRSGLNPIFVSHFLRTFDFKSQARSLISSSKISSISVASMGRIEIPAPAREVQDQIVEVLQKYEALTNDLSIGIPAELAARRKQYEHYRDRLLTFEERV